MQGRQDEHAIWSAVNIHAENFHEITRRLGMDSVALHVLHMTRQSTEMQETGRPPRTVITDRGCALTTDRRISKEWFREEPMNGDRETLRRLKAEYPEAFRRTE